MAPLDIDKLTDSGKVKKWALKDKDLKRSNWQKWTMALFK
jgi:hypothetical protein